MKSKIEKLYLEVVNLEDNKNISDSIKNRLSNVFKLYMSELESASERLEIHMKESSSLSIYKELS